MRCSRHFCVPGTVLASRVKKNRENVKKKKKSCYQRGDELVGRKPENNNAISPMEVCENYHGSREAASLAANDCADRQACVGDGGQSR